MESHTGEVIHLAVQLVSDEVYVVTGEPWRHWFDDWSWKRIRELAHARGWGEDSA
jgi:hypothetical protein